MTDKKGALHEEVRHTEELVVGSDRSFGFVFTAFFGLVALRPQLVPRILLFPFKLIGWITGWRPGFVASTYESMVAHGAQIRLVAAIIAGAFLVTALAMPKVLRPLNVLWMRFGLVLQKIVSPVVLGILFYVGVTPLGIIMRLTGKDLLRLKLDKSAPSYWIVREPPGPAPDTMRNQF